MVNEPSSTESGQERFKEWSGNVDRAIAERIGFEDSNTDSRQRHPTMASPGESAKPGLSQGELRRPSMGHALHTHASDVNMSATVVGKL